MAQLSYVVFHRGKPIAFVPCQSGRSSDAYLEKVLKLAIAYAERCTGTNLTYAPSLISKSELRREVDRLGSLHDWVERVGRTYNLNSIRTSNLAREGNVINKTKCEQVERNG